jgi:hypothetical protein
MTMPFAGHTILIMTTFMLSLLFGCGDENQEKREELRKLIEENAANNIKNIEASAVDCRLTEADTTDELTDPKDSESKGKPDLPPGQKKKQEQRSDNCYLLSYTTRDPCQI